MTFCFYRVWTHAHEAMLYMSYFHRWNGCQGVNIPLYPLHTFERRKPENNNNFLKRSGEIKSSQKRSCKKEWMGGGCTPRLPDKLCSSQALAAGSFYMDVALVPLLMVVCHCNSFTASCLRHLASCHQLTLHTCTWPPAWAHHDHPAANSAPHAQTPWHGCAKGLSRCCNAKCDGVFLCSLQNQALKLTDQT